MILFFISFECYYCYYYYNVIHLNTPRTRKNNNNSSTIHQQAKKPTKQTSEAEWNRMNSQPYLQPLRTFLLLWKWNKTKRKQNKNDNNFDQLFSKWTVAERMESASIQHEKRELAECVANKYKKGKMNKGGQRRGRKQKKCEKRSVCQMPYWEILWVLFFSIMLPIFTLHL